MNYTVEVRAYRQLLSRADLFTSVYGQNALRYTDNGARQLVYVPIYHEIYEHLSPRLLLCWSAIIALLSTALGVFVTYAEKHSKDWLLYPVFAVYLCVPWVMHTWVYHDMTGIILVAWVHVALFFVIRGVQRFNPHQELATASGRIDITQFQAILQWYQRYFFLFIGVLAFVTATFMVGISTILQGLYSRTDDFGSSVYAAVHMPYLQGIYAFASFGSLSLGCAVIRELHLKIHELLRLTAVDSRQVI